MQKLNSIKICNAYHLNNYTDSQIRIFFDYDLRKYEISKNRKNI